MPPFTFIFSAEEKRKQEFFKARGLIKEPKEGTQLTDFLYDFLYDFSMQLKLQHCCDQTYEFFNVGMNVTRMHHDHTL
jgi:hypothetical protein